MTHNTKKEENYWHTNTCNNPMSFYVQFKDKTHLQTKNKVIIDLRISALAEYGIKCVIG